MTVEIECGSGDMERRRAPRSRFVLEGTVRERGRTACPVTIHELSPFGCRVESAVTVCGGNTVWVRIKGIEGLVSRITWSESVYAGIAFETPLHPAVANRLAPTADELCEPQSYEAMNDREFEPGDPMLSRREQIMQGVTGSDLSPLATHKRPGRASLDRLVRRHYVRQVDYRHAERFDQFDENSPKQVRIDGRLIALETVSSNGLKIASDAFFEIGQELTVEFDGCPAMTGHLVWMGYGHAGISLPDDAIAVTPH